MRLALLGAVRSTEVALRALVSNGLPPVATLTLAAEQSNRHSDFIDLSTVGNELGVDVQQIESARDDNAIRRLQELDLDLLLVIGWSEILPAAVIKAARHTALGYHPAPLPEMRGRAVIPWTILQSWRSTASTLFWLHEGLDDGPIAYQHTFGIGDRETSSTLYGKHMDALRRIIDEFAQAPAIETIPGRSQQGTPSYCAQRRPVDGLVDWRESDQQIDRLIRATTRPYPGARGMVVRTGAEAILWSCEPVSVPYMAVPGQVVAIDQGAPVIACGSGFVRCPDVTALDGTPLDFRIQDRFLPYPLALMRWVQERPL